MSKALSLPGSVRGALNYIRSKAPAIARARAKAELSAGRTKDAMLILGGAAANGAGRAYLGNSQGHIRMGKVPYDLDMVIPALGVVGGVADGFGKHSDDAVLFFAGALAPYVAEFVGKKAAALRMPGSQVSGIPFETEGLFDPELEG